VTVAEVKAHEEKISAQLDEARAPVEEIEAHARRNKAEAKIERLKALKTKREEIEKKLHQLMKIGVEATVATQLKADIDAELAKLKTSLGEFGMKRKSQSATS